MTASSKDNIINNNENINTEDSSNIENPNLDEKKEEQSNNKISEPINEKINSENVKSGMNFFKVGGSNRTLILTLSIVLSIVAIGLIIAICIIIYNAKVKDERIKKLCKEN